MANLRSLFPHGSNAFFNENSHFGNSLQPPEPQPAPKNALGVANQGKEKGRKRIALRYRIMRVRLQDEDNAYGSTKGITDALKLCKIIPDDNPEAVSITVEQQKVGHLSDEQIELTITNL